MRGELHYDAIVIGAGTAGLVAGARLAEGGARVCVLAKGVGSTHLAPGRSTCSGTRPSGCVAERRDAGLRRRVIPTTHMPRSASTRWPKRRGGFILGSSQGRCPAIATSAT